MAVILATDVIGIAKTILPADTTAKVDLLDNSAGLKTKRVEALSVVTDDTAAAVLDLWLLVSGTAYRLGATSIIALSGTNGTADRINLLTKLGVVESDNIPVLHVPAGAKLQASVQAAVTAAKTVTITGRARKYE
jgi:hypothetical protein